ncbi:hypothetical protein KSP39_PZI018821 [Platanthera zijinensis]|uniref:HIRAN domain-containing protein n=1 Tax=Platanthera zijinensis TaxID=2320716 RepID=A0AAP0FZ97_9ASPA
MHAPFTNYSGIDFFQSLDQIVLQSRRTSAILGSVQASVVGLRYRFHNASDSKGEQLKKLASILGKFLKNSSELVEVVLERNHNIPADDNAISVLVRSFQENSDGGIDENLPLYYSLLSESVQLGFLPRDVAKWAAPLGDHGFLKLSGFVYPKEALAAALDGNNTKVQCLLSIAQLFFLYKASSSVGTSVDPKFLAEFSAATGKKSFQLSESEESDPEWGRWSTVHELRSPSIRILFPTIDRVKSSIYGIQLS